MTIKFDSHAAKQLVKQMDKYCRSVQKEAKELLNILKSADDWKDNQRIAFQANINEIAKDLNQALILQSDYVNTFDKRIKELTEE